MSEQLAGEIQLQSSPKIVFGASSMDGKLPGELERLQVRRALIVTGNTLATKTPLLSQVKQALGERCAGVYQYIVQHATRPSVLGAVAAAREVGADALVSFGGSSVVDSCRVVGLILATGADFDQLKARFDETGNLIDVPPPVATLPIIAVPTTLSGGEFLSGAGITEPTTREKEYYIQPGLQPRVVILDPKMTVATGKQLWAGTALKIVSDCVEMICSPGHQSYSDALTTAALEIIFHDLPHSVEEPLDLAARGRLQYASFMVMSVLLVPGMGLAAALRHQIGAMWDVPHGIASSIVLPYVMDLNRPAAEERLAILGRVICGGNGKVTSEQAIAAVRQLAKRMGLPQRLREVGAVRAEFDACAEHVVRGFTVRTNPLPITRKEQVIDLLERAY